jgi:hypothetical protein
VPFGFYRVDRAARGSERTRPFLESDAFPLPLDGLKAPRRERGGLGGLGARAPHTCVRSRARGSVRVIGLVSPQRGALEREDLKLDARRRKLNAEGLA